MLYSFPMIAARHKTLPYISFTILIVTLSLLPTLVTAAGKKPQLQFDHPEFQVRLLPRTPDQIAAFYEARGFPKQAIEILRKQCFITVSIRNKSRKVVWMDVSNWKFATPSGSLKRRDRKHWQSFWPTLPLEQRFQSTFRWTLLPESLDFRPEEAEGGNITLPRVPEPITMTAHFTVGDGSDAQRVPIKIEKIRCAEDAIP